MEQTSSVQLEQLITTLEEAQQNPAYDDTARELISRYKISLKCLTSFNYMSHIEQKQLENHARRPFTTIYTLEFTQDLIEDLTPQTLNLLQKTKKGLQEYEETLQRYITKTGSE